MRLHLGAVCWLMIMLWGCTYDESPQNEYSEEMQRIGDIGKQFELMDSILVDMKKAPEGTEKSDSMLKVLMKNHEEIMNK